MRDTFKGKAKRWFVVGGLLLLMSITSVGYVQAAGLSENEIYWLTYMREEEKLARDVYLYFYDKYGSGIFYNISKSEQTHMNAIKTLLDRYGITDPAANQDVGQFTDLDGVDTFGLQALYDTLVAGGGEFLVEALKVGVFIEITDIEDLTAAIAATAPTPRDIVRVYTNLRQGSLNHWDAFCSELAKFGVTCDPYDPYKLIIEELSTPSSGPGPAPNSGDGIPDGSGWEVPPKGTK